MFQLERHGPLAAALTLSALALLLPFRSTTFTPPVLVPHPPPSTGQAETLLRLGEGAQVRVGLSQGVVAPGVPQEMALAVEVTGILAQAQARRAMVLALDRSGSMHGDDIRHARTAAAALVNGLGDLDEIAVVTFSSQPGVDVSLRPADAAGRAAALAAIDGIEARGGTHLSGGMELAIAEAARSTLPVRRVVLVSDGEPTEGKTTAAAITSLAEGAARQGLTLSTLAVGSQSPGGLMERVAVSAGGNFRFIRNGSGMAQVIAAELDASSRVAVQEVVVELDLPGGVQFQGVEGALADVNGSRLTLRVGDVVAGETRRVAVQVMMPAVQDMAAVDIQARGRRGSLVVQAMGNVAVRTSPDAVEVAGSRVAWVAGSAQLAQAVVQMRQAAEEVQRGNRAAGMRSLSLLAEKMEKDAASQPQMAPQAAAMKKLSRAVGDEADTGAAANVMQQEAFNLMR